MRSRAEVRRALALRADADRLPLAADFAALAGAGPLAPADAGELIVAYLLDPFGGALLATTDDRRRWLTGPLFRAIGPGNAVPVDDVVAALIAGPVLAKSDGYVAHRWAPRADDAIALAVAALPAAAQIAALERLASDGGPEPGLLAQSTVQCGRVLAWSPHLLDAPIAARLVDELLALLGPARPRPLLDAVAHCLGPIAAHEHPLAARVRAGALAALDATHRPAPASFADEIASIGKARRLPDQDGLLALPAREVAQAGAYILGFAAPLDRAAFAAHRALVIDRPDGAELVDAFADGLVAAAHVPALTELAAALLDADADAPLTALGIAAALPLDPIAPRLIAELEDERPSHRARACAAVELLDDDAVDPALARRLADPSPEVAAAAARALIERGRGDLVSEHASRESHPIRRAIALAATGDLSVPVIGELVRGVSRELGELGGEATDATPIVRLLGDCLLGSIDGLETAANLIGGVPESAALIALAASIELDRDVGVLAPPTERAHLASVVLRVAGADSDDPELAALALFLLARVSAGDAVIADVIADALARTEGHAANLVAALAELRVPTPKTAAALAALVAADQPIGARVVAAAACGRALARDHEAWRDIRELLELGTFARAAAWNALRDRARRG